MNTGAELQVKLRHATVRALNRAALDLEALAVANAPRDPAKGDRLANSAKVDTATFEFLLAQVLFTAPDAAAQEVGHALQHWKTGKAERHWEVHNRPGGGQSHYLEGAVKALAPKFEGYFYEEWRKVLHG